MRKHLPKIALLCAAPFTLMGCNETKEEPITNKDESTIIKNAKSTDEYLKNKDYKSIAYAYIYNIKDGVKSYESVTNGTVKAKVLFFDYDIKYNTIINKFGDTFYSKEVSTSTLFNLTNEFYSVDREKILVSREPDKYNVYTMEDYRKTSYAPNQYTIQGYVFNDDSILKSEVISDKGDIVTIKYTLDNEKATNLVKVDLKMNGDLSSYPSFKTVEITLSMKRDFTPVSYALRSVYDASKPVVGSSEVTQEGECVFSNINGTVTIPNETFLAQQLGKTPIVPDLDGGEREIKDGLWAALEKLDLKKGVSISGDLKISLFGSEIAVNLGGNMKLDLSRISSDKIFDILRLYAKVEGDETFNSIASLVKSFAGDKLGEYADILERFKSLEVVYDGNGALYLVPTNQDKAHVTAVKLKLSDILDAILREVNIVGLITEANKDLVSFKKIEGADKDNYQVEIVLNEKSNQTISDKLDELFKNESLAILKTGLGYKAFDSIGIKVGVAAGAIKDLDVSFNYLKQGSGEEVDTVVTLAKLHLEAKSGEFDFESKISAAKEIYDAFAGISALKSRIDELLKNVYLSRGYLANVEKAIAEFEALTDLQKGFFKSNTLAELQRIKSNISGLLKFLDVYHKYDLSKVTNEDLLVLIKAYKDNVLDPSALKVEIGEEAYSKVCDLSSLIDYSLLTSALPKIQGDDETAWGFTEAEIRGIKLLFDLSAIDDSVTNYIMLQLLLNGAGDIDTFKTKVMSLYDALN